MHHNISVCGSSKTNKHFKYLDVGSVITNLVEIRKLNMESAALGIVLPNSSNCYTAKTLSGIVEIITASSEPDTDFSMGLNSLRNIYIFSKIHTLFFKSLV